MGIVMSRISIKYFPDAHNRSNDPVFYAFMFIRDTHTGIMPFRSGRSYPFEVKLKKEDNRDVRNRVASILGSIGRYEKRDLEEALWDAIDTLTHYLVANGEVYLEIVKSDSVEEDEYSKRLEFLPLGRVIRLPRSYLQVVPIASWKKIDKKYCKIPVSKIWHLKLPRRLGTPRHHRKMISKLNLLSKPMPEFVFKDNELGGSVKFDFMAHRHSKEVAVEHTTSNWGSIRSLSQVKGTTEYYYIVNRLQATYSQALIREHLIDQMNLLLERLDIDNKIFVEGLAGSSDIKKSIKLLEEGKIGFAEALESIEN